MVPFVPPSLEQSASIVIVLVVLFLLMDSSYQKNWKSPLLLWWNKQQKFIWWHNSVDISKPETETRAEPSLVILLFLIINLFCKRIQECRHSKLIMICER